MLEDFSDVLVPLIIPAKGGGTQAVRAVLTSSDEDKHLLKVNQSPVIVTVQVLSILFNFDFD